MSKQLNFFITQEDHNRTNLLLQENEIFVLTNNKISMWQNVLPKNEDEIFQVYLGCKRFFDNVYLYTNEFTGEKHIDILKSNILEFSLGGFYPYDRNVLQRARLYCPTEYYNDVDVLVKKPKEYISWCNSVIKIFKTKLLKRFEYETTYFYSQSAIDWILTNNAQLTMSGQSWNIGNIPSHADSRGRCVGTGCVGGL
jgi:hypothetical protein